MDQETKVILTCKGEDVNVHVEGDLFTAIKMLLAGFRNACKSLYDGLAEDNPIAAEEIMHNLQVLFAPTSEFWDFSTIK